MTLEDKILEILKNCTEIDWYERRVDGEEILTKFQSFDDQKAAKEIASLMRAELIKFANEYGLAKVKTTTEQIVDEYLKTRK
jgi:hypothetical protein